jgi:hypothetical protein
VHPAGRGRRGNRVWHHVSTLAEDQQHSISSTTAQLLQDAAPITVDDQGVGTYVPVRAAARWVAPDGSERTGPVMTEPGGRSGGRIEIWVDRAGDVVNPPVNSAASAVLIVAMTVVVALAWGALLIIVQYLFRGRLDRRRIAEWGNEWLRVEPLWSGRSRGTGTTQP